MKAKAVNQLDEYLRESVERQLDFAPNVPSDQIGVAISNGVVSLSGFVGTYADKLAAERAVKSVYGVCVVANDIEVKPPAEIVDPDLADNIAEAFRLNVAVPNDKIKVVVREGWVTIEGKVDWGWQREAAEKAIRYLAGVRGVTNNIEVEPGASAENIPERIENALSRNAEVDARRIRVAAREGSVTLSGNVRSWAEKRQAQWTAWAVPGVVNVVNQIEVVP
jgi:osmotically-inducible protein OsmY